MLLLNRKNANMDVGGFFYFTASGYGRKRASPFECLDSEVCGANLTYFLPSGGSPRRGGGTMGAADPCAASYYAEIDEWAELGGRSALCFRGW